MTKLRIVRSTRYFCTILAAWILSSTAFADAHRNEADTSLITVRTGSNLVLESKEINAPRQDWLSSVRDVLEREEYKPSEGDDESGRRKLQAPNRAHNFRTYFDDDGVRVVPRDGSRKWEFTMSLDSIETNREGRRGRQLAPRKGRPVAKENSVEYAHGGITEWYKNDKRGLELGFTIESRGEEQGDTITVNCRTSRGYEATVDPTGKALVFTDRETDTQLHLKGLNAFDVEGKPLLTRFEPIDSGFSIVVDTAGANFPITVDPWLVKYEWIGSGEDGSNFGISVAGAGDVDNDGFDDVVVGADTYDIVGYPDIGMVFLFLGNEDGLSTQYSWTYHGSMANSRFGQSVASAGDVNGDNFSDVVIGEPRFNSGKGKAYVFLGSDIPNGRGKGLKASPIWKIESTLSSNYYGCSVASAGDVNGDGYDDVIVGAWGYDKLLGLGVATNAGRAYIYFGNSEGLSTSSNWTAGASQEGGHFGASVAGVGDLNCDGYDDVAVGSNLYNNGSSDEGIVFVYYGHASGPHTVYDWAYDADQSYAYLGISVSGAGDVNKDGCDDLLIGADHYDHGQTNEGKAYLFLGSHSGLASTPSWTSESDVASAQFGFSVAKAGDVNGDGYGDVIIGAKYLSNAQTQEGRAYVYHGQAGSVGLPPSPNWKAEANMASAEFGTSVAGAGDVNNDGFDDVIVGAPVYLFGEPAYHIGRAYVYYGSAFGLPWQTENFNTASRLGYSLASGDLNGDSFDDLAVGAPYYSGGQSYEGQILLYKGSATGINSPQPPANSLCDKPIESDAANSFSGYSVAVANVNGNHNQVSGAPYKDLVVGAPSYDSNSGQVYVYEGQNIFGTTLPTATILDGASIVGSTGARFGGSVANVGDVNNDGYEDILVGAGDRTFNGNSFAGGAYLFYGSSTGVSSTNKTVLNPDIGGSINFGKTVAAAGDLNGDGYSDILIGIGSLVPTVARAYVFYGSSGGINPSQPTVLSITSSVSKFGTSVASADDINSDGFDDIVVGAPGTREVYVYYGGIDGVSIQPQVLTISQGGTPNFGKVVSGAGDLNADGYADILVADPDYGNGKVYLYLGSKFGLLEDPDWTAEGIQYGEHFGGSLIGVGHMDSDDYSDIVIGSDSWDYSNTQSDDGKITVFRGGSLIYPVDSDGDRLDDRSEEFTYHTDKNNEDSDGDGLSDFDEIFETGTDPNDPDMDDDGYSDLVETRLGTLASGTPRAVTVYRYNSRSEVKSALTTLGL